MPFAPVHLLFINLLTDSLPAIALGLEPDRSEVMSEKPRLADESILTKDFLSKIGLEGLVIGAMTMISFLTGYNQNGTLLGSTYAFGTLCLARLFHGYNCKSDHSVIFTKGLFHNKWLQGAFVLGAVLITTVLTVPGFHNLFKVETLNLMQLPQLTQTMGNLMTSISDFIPQMQNWIREFSHDNQDIMKLVDQLQFQPDQAIKWGISLLGNGVGNMMNTTMSAVGSIASGLATFFISFSFACYILFQKEKLHLQVRKVIFAFIPKQKADAILNICSLTYRTFANFLAGQCLEAVILGMMFVITLSILKMPYALLIGILIAFTALVPIFGAFIGCAVGSFLIFMVNPKQAVLFIIVFLLLQQIEGNLIYPHVVGGSVGLPSIWVLAAVTIGGNLMGIIGMLIFIPLVSVFYTIFRGFVYLRLKKQHIKRVTRTDVEEYAEEEIASSFIVPNEK